MYSSKVDLYAGCRPLLSRTMAAPPSTMFRSNQWLPNTVHKCTSTKHNEHKCTSAEHSTEMTVCVLPDTSALLPTYNLLQQAFSTMCTVWYNSGCDLVKSDVLSVRRNRTLDGIIFSTIWCLNGQSLPQSTKHCPVADCTKAVLNMW